MALSPNLCLVDVHISKVFVRKWKMNDFSQNVAFEVRENSKKNCIQKGNQTLKSGMRDQIKKIKAEVHP